MLEVTDSHDIAAPADSVYEYVWNAELWPRITPHVKRIEYLEREPERQRFRMTVEAHGREHTVESEREGLPGRRVTYRQTRPPAFLVEHSGEWRLEERPGGVTVHLTHRAVVDHAKALSALSVSTPDEADEVIRDTLRQNGAKTVLAIKAHLEAADG